MSNIVIQEIYPPIKVPGKTSFLISFDFDPVILDTVKSFPWPIVFHKTLKAWEIPTSTLSIALDSLTRLGDIKFSLLSEAEKNLEGLSPLTEAEISSLNFNPYKHQIEGINFGLKHKKWLLTFGMGCGKTATAIGLAETLKHRGLIEHCLVICSVASLRQNWKKEIKSYGKESCMILGEKISKTGKLSYMSVKERIEQLKSIIPEFFIIVNIESLRNDDLVEKLMTGPNKIDCIIVDEIHRSNNKTSQSGHNLLKLKAEYKIGMSGTLLVNNPLDLYLPLTFIESEHSTLTNFKSTFCTFGSNKFTNYQIVGYKNLDLLKDELDSCSLRRTLDEVVDMPLKTVETELLEMNDDHQKFYEAIKQGVKNDSLKVELNSKNLLALCTRLRQASVCPDILTTEKVSSTKIDRCVELIQDLTSQKEKVVVFSTFKEPLNVIANKIKDLNPLICTGDYSDDFVNKNIEKFLNDPKALVCLCTHSRMGTGFNLNVAAYAIMLDTPYTYSSLDQSICRLYRLNNTRPCFIKILACKNSIDERILKIVNTKRDLGDFIMDGKPSESLNNELFDIIKNL